MLWVGVAKHWFVCYSSMHVLVGRLVAVDSGSKETRVVPTGEEQL